MIADEILEQALEAFNNDKGTEERGHITSMQPVATCCLSNNGGVALFHVDGDCVVAQYYDLEPELYEIEYVDNEDNFNEEVRPEQIAIFKVGQIDVRLDHCVLTNR